MGRFPHVSPEPRRDQLRLSSGGEPQTHGRATGIKTSRRRREERTKKKTTRLFPDVADALEMDTGKRSWNRKRSCPWRPPGSASWARTFSSRCVCTDLLAVTRP